MRYSLWAVVSILLWLAPVQAAQAEITLEAPQEIAAGDMFEVHWSGDADPQDFVTLVERDMAEGGYGPYHYAKETTLRFVAPDDPGTYEIRFLSKETSYPTLARRTITVTPVSASLQGPSSVESGGTIEIGWEGPGHDRDFVTVVEVGTPEQKYGPYRYTKTGNPVKITVPEKAGAYEARYLTGQKYYTLARHPFEVTGVSASIEGPASATEGSTFEVRFEGTGNTRDFITIVAAGTAEGQYGNYAYAKGESVELRAPEAPGDYEIRYLTAREYSTLASQPITVGAAGASLKGPAEVRGGEVFPVEWSGIGNDHDYITIVEPTAGPGDYGEYAYVRQGNPVSLLAPLEPGDYELRYAMGSSRKTLARQAIRVTEPASRPGELRVVDSTVGERVALAQGAAVELILDASGSMLKRQDGARRIDIAKTVLSGLVEDALPPGTPFALRVFGHREADSCRTDLEIALSPLAAATATDRIAAIEAKNLAKTPIARSLELVAQDLAGTEGPSVIVLVTDGEETCGGDPAAAVQALRDRGFDVRVNIVGFAIDDDELEASFQSWADLGGGKYYDSGGADDLEASLRESLRAAFE
ncbi:MAG: VWA domain-containing protein, partial [Acidobacteriota bacterium]